MMDPGCIFKVEQTGVADGLDLEGERKSGVKNDSQTFGLGNWGMQVTSPGMEKKGWSRLGGEVRSSVLCMLHWRSFNPPREDAVRAAGHMRLEFRGHIGAENRHLSIVSPYRVFEAVALDENL